MPRKTVRSAWDLLKRKVKEFEEFSKCSVILVGLVENAYVYEGSLSLKVGFATDQLVQDKFRAALTLSSANFDVGLPDEDSETSTIQDTSLADILQIHVFDMNVALLRKIINTAITPEAALSSKYKRKGIFSPENAPRWWTDTGLPFTSVNHKSGEIGQFRQVELWRLVESLQQFNGITPNIPSKLPRVEAFRSRFYQNESIDQTNLSSSTSEAEDLSPSETTSNAEPRVEDPRAGFCSESDPCQSTGTRISCPNSDSTNQELPSMFARRELVVNFSLDEVKNDPKKVASVLLQAENWDEFTVLCNQIASLEHDVMDIPASEWENAVCQGPLPCSIPPNYTVLETTANGNCMFNAISLILNGSEQYGLYYRLFTIVNSVDRLPEFSKYILLEFKENWEMFAHMVSDEELLVENDSPQEILEKIFRAELKGSLNSFYRDCSILHVYLLAQALNRPIHQHCARDGHEYCLLRKTILPPMDKTNRQPLHIVWVPSPENPNVPSVSHIVPAVCAVGIYGIPKDHCPLLSIECCVFQAGANIQLPSEMVECSVCHQMVHYACAHIDITTSDVFMCGCEKFSTRIKLKDPSLYRTMKAIDYLKADNRILHIGRNVLSKPSLRQFIYQKRPHWLPAIKRQLATRLGPFIDDDVVHEIMMQLRTVIPLGLQMFIPTIYLFETVVEMMTQIEEIPRILAEFILNGQYV